MSIFILPFAAPVLVLIAALIGVLRRHRRSAMPLNAIEASAALAVATAVACAALLITTGPGTSPILGSGGVGLSARLDVVSAAMLLLVSFIGWIVVRYSVTYLDGEVRQGAFMAWLCFTLAMVMLLVIAGSLVQLLAAWMAIGLGIHRLLLFYPDRIAAQRAARKSSCRRAWPICLYRRARSC